MGRTKDEKSNGSKQKNKRGDSKVETDDSPEIPARGETSDISGLPSRSRPEIGFAMFQETSKRKYF